MATETVVERTAEALLKAGRAVLVRQHPPVVRQRNGTARMVARTGVDFFGAIANGRAIGFDVKSSSTPRLRLEVSGKQTLKPHQRAELLALDALGALAGVLVALKVEPGRPHHWFWVGIQLWLELRDLARDEKRLSIPLAHLAAYARRVPLDARGHLDLISAWSDP